MAKKSTPPAEPTGLRITQRRSGIGGTARQRETLRTLGLRRVGASVTREDRPEVRGMVRAVAHLVRVEEIHEEVKA